MNHYDVLEVSPKASSEVIRAAYKSLMQRHHPDKRPNGAESGERAALIAQAYEVLSNPDKRLAYDRELRRLPSADSVGMVRPLDRARKPDADPRAWYALLLILCITGAGGLIFMLSNGTALPGPAASEHRPPTVADAPAGGAEAGPSETRASVSGEGGAPPQTQTFPAFVTHLSISLAPADPASGRPEHVLHIPDLGLRVATGESGRWIQRVEGQRPILLRQLLARLANADYDQLVKPDGDLYLRRVIEETLNEGIGFQAAESSAAPGQSPKKPLEALLPQSYSLR